MRRSIGGKTTTLLGWVAILVLVLAPAGVIAQVSDPAIADPCYCDCGAPSVCVTDSDCDDGNLCNGTEKCSAGECTLGVELNCEDSDVCDGVGYCNPQVGCQATAPLQCDDGDLCTGVETCDASLGCQLSASLDCTGGCGVGEVGHCDAINGCECLPLPCELQTCATIGNVVGQCDPVTFDCDFDLIGADLSGENLSGQNLSGMNLSGANLSGANLTNTDLSDSNLSNANLSNSNLDGADLTGADLTGTDLAGATFPTGLPSMGGIGLVLAILGILFGGACAVRFTRASGY